MSILLLLSDTLPYDVLKIISNYCGKTELSISIEKFDKTNLKSIFTYDYISIKTNMRNSGIAEELMAYIFHPRNMNKWFGLGHDEFMDFIN